MVLPKCSIFQLNFSCKRPININIYALKSNQKSGQKYRAETTEPKHLSSRLKLLPASPRHPQVACSILVASTPCRKAIHIRTSKVSVSKSLVYSLRHTFELAGHCTAVVCCCVVAAMPLLCRLLQCRAQSSIG